MVFLWKKRSDDKTLNKTECIHENMPEIPRCPICKRTYSRGSRDYHTPLNQCYIRKGSGGSGGWIPINFGFCADCEKIYEIGVSKTGGKK